MARDPAYHHGNLRRVILDASIELIAERGVGALSMREVARRAGVTHGAPYHHFADRNAILAAIAQEGYERLTLGMRAAVDAVPRSMLRERFEASGRAYFEFAIHHTAHFRVMCRPELSDPGSHPAVDAAGAQAFVLLVDLVRELQQAGLAPRGDPMPLVLTGWSTAHGLAALWVDGQLARGVPGVSREPGAMSAAVAGTLGRLFAAAGAFEAATERAGEAAPPRKPGARKPRRKR